MSRELSPAMSHPQSPPRRPWRLVLGEGGDLSPVDGATNMAVDSALLEGVKAGAPPVLRLYRWSPATLSFGRNQPARSRYDVDAGRDRGIAFVRRPTGGQAVLHDDELTYAVVAPVTELGRPRAAYGRINQALVAGLRRLGLEAALAARGSSPPDEAPERSPAGAAPAGLAGGPRGGASGPAWDAACFRRPERGEVVVNGAKLVGSAQRLEDRTILQHGSILMGGTQAPAEALLLAAAHVGAAGSDPSPGAGPGRSPGWTTLDRALGRRPGLDELVAAVTAGFREALAVELDPAPLTDRESGALGELVVHYRSEEWTWRR